MLHKICNAFNIHLLLWSLSQKLLRVDYLFDLCAVAGGLVPSISIPTPYFSLKVMLMFISVVVSQL